jgi:hypothetical protein
MNLSDIFGASFGFNKEEPVVTPLENGLIRLDIKCVSCKEQKSVVCARVGYDQYKAGEYVQKAFPLMSANDRELIQSHMCAKCFDGCTQEEEEETENDDSTRSTD